MWPKMQLFDPHKNLFAAFSFDDTTNVHNVASLYEQYFSCCTVSTGIELTVSLLSDKVMTIWSMSKMCGFANKVSHLLCLLASLHTLAFLSFDCFTVGKYSEQCTMHYTVLSSRT